MQRALGPVARKPSPVTRGVARARGFSLTFAWTLAQRVATVGRGRRERTDRREQACAQAAPAGRGEGAEAHHRGRVQPPEHPHLRAHRRDRALLRVPRPRHAPRRRPRGLRLHPRGHHGFLRRLPRAAHGRRLRARKIPRSARRQVPRHRGLHRARTARRRRGCRRVWRGCPNRSPATPHWCRPTA